MKSNARNIVVKTLLSSEEYLELSRKCTDADLTHSKALRDLVRSWMPKRNVIAPQQTKERTGRVHNMAMSGRRGGAFRPLRV